MLVCPNCNHYNPDGATQCEACYTPLPATTSCPNCGTSVQTDATFCGQCGFNLRSTTATATEPTIGTDFSSKMPDLVAPNQSVQPEPVVLKSSSPDLTPVPATAVSHPFLEPNSGGASVPPPPPTITIAPETEQFSPPPPPLEYRHESGRQSPNSEILKHQYLLEFDHFACLYESQINFVAAQSVRRFERAKAVPSAAAVVFWSRQLWGVIGRL